MAPDSFQTHFRPGFRKEIALVILGIIYTMVLGRENVLLLVLLDMLEFLL